MRFFISCFIRVLVIVLAFQSTWVWSAVYKRIMLVEQENGKQQSYHIYYDDGVTSEIVNGIPFFYIIADSANTVEVMHAGIRELFNIAEGHDHAFMAENNLVIDDMIRRHIKDNIKVEIDGPIMRGIPIGLMPLSSGAGTEGVSISNSDISIGINGSMIRVNLKTKTCQFSVRIFQSEVFGLSLVSLFGEFLDGVTYRLSAESLFISDAEKEKLEELKKSHNKDKLPTGASVDVEHADDTYYSEIQVINSDIHDNNNTTDNKNKGDALSTGASADHGVVGNMGTAEVEVIECDIISAYLD